jgi:hypothetical protein
LIYQHFLTENNNNHNIFFYCIHILSYYLCDCHNNDIFLDKHDYLLSAQNRIYKYKSKNQMKVFDKSDKISFYNVSKSSNLSSLYLLLGYSCIVDIHSNIDWYWYCEWGKSYANKLCIYIFEVYMLDYNVELKLILYIMRKEFQNPDV